VTTEASEGAVSKFLKLLIDNSKGCVAGTVTGVLILSEIHRIVDIVSQVNNLIERFHQL
jgi:hypothetical protein